MVQPNALPKYEETLRVGHWAIERFLPGIIYRGAMQYWYYIQLILLAETGKAELSLGCLRCLVRNLMHEAKKASEMEGVDCKGTVYRGLKR